MRVCCLLAVVLAASDGRGSAWGTSELVEQSGSSGAPFLLTRSDPRTDLNINVDAEDLLIALSALQRSRRIHTEKSSEAACKALHEAAEHACRVHGGAEGTRSSHWGTCLQLAGSALAKAVGEEDRCDDARAEETGPRQNAAKFSSFHLDSSTHKFLDQRHPRGHCLYTTRFCAVHPELSGRMVDERDLVYDELADLLDDEARKEACLARAEVNWRWCGHVRDASVSMVWRPPLTGLMDGDWSEYPPSAQDPSRDDSSFWPAAGPDHVLLGSAQESRVCSHGGWKPLHVWVAGSVFTGRVSAPNTPAEVLARELAKDDSLQLGVPEDELAEKIRKISKEWQAIFLADYNAKSR